MRFSVPAILFALVMMVVPARPVSAQRPTGAVSLFADYFPNQNSATELRARLFVEEKVESELAQESRLVVTASGFVEGLLSRRLTPGSRTELEAVDDAIVRVLDGNIEWRSRRVDLQLGYARVAWGNSTRFSRPT